MICSFRLRLAIPLIDGEMSRCLMYNVNFTEKLLDNITEADPNWPTQSCIFGFEFDHSEIPYTTIATEVHINDFCSAERTKIVNSSLFSNFKFCCSPVGMGLWKRFVAHNRPIGFFLWRHYRWSIVRLDCWSVWSRSSPSWSECGGRRCWHCNCIL